MIPKRSSASTTSAASCAARRDRGHRAAVDAAVAFEVGARSSADGQVAIRTAQASATGRCFVAARHPIDVEKHVAPHARAHHKVTVRRDRTERERQHALEAARDLNSCWAVLLSHREEREAVCRVAFSQVDARRRDTAPRESGRWAGTAVALALQICRSNAGQPEVSRATSAVAAATPTR